MSDQNVNIENELEKNNEKDQRAFCFCVGEVVDCLPGVVLDCNNKRTRKCPLSEEEQKKVRSQQPKAQEKKQEKKKDNRSFCFCMHSQVDCLPGVVLDCNNHKREVCPLVEEVLAVNKEKEKQVQELKEKFKKKDSKKDEKNKEEVEKEETTKEEAKQADTKKRDNKASGKENKKKDNRSFCFCMHSQVDCLPGVVLDCNNHKREVCPLVEEVLAVNKEKEKQVQELKEKFKKKDSKKDEKNKEEVKEEEPKKEESKQEDSKKDSKKYSGKDSKKKDNRSFCFCMHSQVDCLPGVVLDCNNHKREVCPLVEEVLAVNKEKEKQVQELKEKFKKKDSKKDEKNKEEVKKEETAKEESKKDDTKKSDKKESGKDTKKKDNRAFCFCMGAQVNCLPGVVLDCNNHKRTFCPLLLEALPFNEEQKEKVKDITVMFDNK